MNIDLTEKRACIFGLPGGGKSNFACYLADKYGARAFVFDPMREFPLNAAFDVYRPRDKDKGYPARVPELEKLLQLIVKIGKYKLAVIDEAGDYAPSKPTPLSEYLAKFNRECRHPEYGRITPVWCCQRPTQLNQDITEMSHYLFIFKLKGKNDIDYLNDFSRGLGDAVFTMPKYHYMVVNEDRDFVLHKPVPKMALGRKIKGVQNE